MAKTRIEWCDCTWNPIAGCCPVSAGCDNCYAARMATRLACNPMTSKKYAGLSSGGQWTGEVRLFEDALVIPERWKRPMIVFVDSMGDLFHSRVRHSELVAVFARMVLYPRHVYLVLTKRAERMHDESFSLRRFDNVWMGVSVEDQKAANGRIPHLRRSNFSHRFLSCEPLLGPVTLDLKGIEWVIAGGETGPGARPMHTEWVRSVRDQCVAAHVPFFFKGWGGCVPMSQLRDEHADHVRSVRAISGIGVADETGYVIKKKYSGDVLDGKKWHEFPHQMRG